MDRRLKLEYILRKARISWRAVCDSPDSTQNERRRALSEWKKVRREYDAGVMALKMAFVERRKENADRRKANADRRLAAERQKAGRGEDRRQSKRRP